jgi:polar amino acid transport system substrate-binding protein
MYFSILIIGQATAQDVRIEVVSTSYRPYAYEEDGEFKGYVFDIATKVLNRAEMPFNLQIMPWMRAYQYALEYPDYLIGGLGRTEKREDSFFWIGPVSSEMKNSFFKLKSNPLVVNSIEDVKKNMIGVERGSYNSDFLTENDFQQVFETRDLELLIQMLVNKRLQLILYSENQINVVSDYLGIDRELFVIALPGISVTEYLAMGKKSSPEVIKRLQQAYTELSDEGAFFLY